MSVQLLEGQPRLMIGGAEQCETQKDALITPGISPRKQHNRLLEVAKGLRLDLDYRPLFDASLQLMRALRAKSVYRESFPIGWPNWPPITTAKSVRCVAIPRRLDGIAGKSSCSICGLGRPKSASTKWER